jgi:hypothetical protein
MKTGMNLLLWTTHVTAEHFPLFAKLKQARPPTTRTMGYAMPTLWASVTRTTTPSSKARMV